MTVSVVVSTCVNRPRQRELLGMINDTASALWVGPLGTKDGRNPPATGSPRNA